MFSKKLMWMGTLIILSILISVGCTGATPVVEEVEEPTEEAIEKPAIRLAAVSLGSVDDQSWNFKMQQAVLRVGEERGYEADYAENVQPADVERVIREYADNGYNLIITHSFNYGEILFNVAPDYPDVNFAWPGGMGKTADNIADYDQPFYQAAYFMGVLAGGVSETGIFSFLSGFDIPVCHSMYESFRLGAQVTNPDAEVLYTIIGNWGDVAKSKEAVLAHVAAGADYAASCGIGPTLGAIEAAEEADIYASSYVGNMSSISPDHVLLNMVWDLYPLVTIFVDEIEAGTFSPGKYYSYGVAEDHLRVEINPALADVVPDEAKQAAEEILQQIKDGTFEIPYIPEAES